MVSEGGFNFSENAPIPKDSSGQPQAENLNNPEGQLRNSRQPMDTGQVTDSVSAKFRAEAGLTSFESGNLNPRDFRESVRNASGVATVETRQTTFKTTSGDITGWEHSGKDSAGRDQRMFTSNTGETFRVERGENGQTTLRNETSGTRTEALRSQQEIKPINRSAAEVGPAKVHRAGEPVDLSSSEYTSRIQQARAGVEARNGIQPGLETAPRVGEGPPTTVREPGRGNTLPVETPGNRLGPETPAETAPRGNAELQARFNRGPAEAPVEAPLRTGNRLDLPPSRDGRPETVVDRTGTRPVPPVETGVRGPGNRGDIPAPRVETGPRGGDTRESRPFNQNDFRQRVKQLEADPGNVEARRDITRMMREQPGESRAMVRAMQERGEAVPGQVDRMARITEGRAGLDVSPGDRASVSQRLQEQIKALKPGDSLQTNLSKQDLKAMSGQTEALQELLKNPESRQMLQKLLADGGQGKGQANLDILSKQLGLDANSPSTQKFFQDLGNRLNSLKAADLQSGNVKLQDILKGLDPNGAKALENYLTHGIGKTGDLRLAQLDPARFNSLRTLLDAQTAKPGSQTDLAQVLKALQGRPLNLDQPTANAFGQNLRELGLQLKAGTDTGIGAKAPASLSELIQRSLESGTGKAGLATINGDLIAKLSSPQEQALRTLIENSGKLSSLIETGKVNLIRGTESGTMLSDIMARLPQSMRGESFTVRGEILGALVGDAGSAIARANTAAQFSEFVTSTIRADGTQVMVSPIEILSGKPIDPVSGLPYDPFTGKLLDPTTGRVVGSVRPGELSGKLDEKSESAKKEQEKLDLELEEEAVKKRKLLILLQARKLREQKEREIKEKELREQKRKEEDKKRTKYVVKHGDTLESIAEKQLRDIKMSALIYDINKKVIPVATENGKTVVRLRRGLVIWLPSPFEQREFRGKIASGKLKPGSTPGTAGGIKKFATVEEELAAKFGENWSGDDTASASTGSVTNQLLESSVKKSEERRKNIESVLGSFEKPQGKTAGEGRTKYVVRLGDSLKSVAMKHPMVRDISLWKLIAEINKISTAVDTRGAPKAKLTRGSEIKIPSAQEIADYRSKLGLAKAYDPNASRYANPEEGAELHICDNCGRMTGIKTTICVCGQSTRPPEKRKSTPVKTRVDNQDAASVMLEAAGLIGTNESKEESGEQSGKGSGEGSEAKVVGGPVKTRVDREQTGAAINDSNQEDKPEILEELDAISRLVKHAPDASAGKPLIYSLQLYMDGGWRTIMSYEISETRTLRHDDYSSDRRKSVKIDLPGRAAEELAKNDLTGNWKNYKRKFLRARS